MKERKKYQIRIQGELIEVQKKLYDTYYKMYRREKYLEEKDASHGIVNYSSLDTEDTTGEDMIPDRDSDNVEELVISDIMRERLHSALAKLTSQEYALIHALYFEDKTERQTATYFDLPQKTIHNRMQAILFKLLKLIENEKFFGSRPL